MDKRKKARIKEKIRRGYHHHRRRQERKESKKNQGDFK